MEIATIRQKIEGQLVILADANAVPDSDLDHENRQALALFNASVIQPPYKMLAFSHYEDQQWLILLNSGRLLDIWYGEGLFSVQAFERAH